MSASERAYLHVKSGVLDGSIPGGELISENEIAERLGMSRTPVRAAFGQLEAEGLLRLYPKRGALVVPVSAQETEAVIEARWVIERYAIERVIERPEDVPEKLHAAIDTQANLEDNTAFVEADRAFHRTLVAGTGNPILLTLYDSLRDRQRRMSHATARLPERRRRSLDEHRQLADAIADGDGARAYSVLRTHLDGALEAIRGR